MARRSAARSSSTSHSPSTHAAPAPPAPAPPAPAPSPVSSGMGGGLGSAIVGGIASGVGSGIGFGIANRAVDSLFGPRETVVRHEGVPAAPAAAPMAMPTGSSNQSSECKAALDDYERCMKDFQNDQSACQMRFDFAKARCF
eukprot:GDKI01010506.1.p2 GENE.GDKI01010506.1~~GDKI01010506.1.p2  ORF type:complete len:158 (+),score=11.36 GDKI01010506.1:49-474(+)